MSNDRPKDPTYHLIFAGVGLVVGLLLLVADAGAIAGFVLLVTFVWFVTALVRLLKVHAWAKRRRGPASHG